MSIEVDIRENEILKQDPVLLETILIDRSRPKNGSKKPQHIIWAIDNYEPLGAGYGENEQISIDAITGEHGDIIQLRVRKIKAEQQSRIRDKAEVFTPSWICNAQNNLVDDYKEDEIYTWDYVMEQKAKAEWDKYHFGDPNPYAGLPKLNIYTFDLGKALSGFEDVEDSAFNFKEFFRTWTGDPERDRRPMPDGAEGKFVIGLAADIKILEGKKLLDYIKNYDKKYVQKLG